MHNCCWLHMYSSPQFCVIMIQFTRVDNSGHQCFWDRSYETLGDLFIVLPSIKCCSQNHELLLCTNIMPSLVGVQPQSSGSRLGLQTVASVQSVCNTDELLRRLQQGMDSDAVSVHSIFVRGVVVAHGSAVAQHYIF